MVAVHAHSRISGPTGFARRVLYVAILCSVSVSACVPALPAECDSCSYVAGLIQNSAALSDPGTTPAASQGEACSLNAGSGTISDSESGFTITSTPNGALGDVATTLVADYDGIYVGGFAGIGVGDTGWRIEKRDRVSGALIGEFGTGGFVASNPSGSADAVNDLAIDASGIYAVGIDRGPGGANGQWRIEKRDRMTGALVPAFGTGGVVLSNVSGFDDSARSVAVNDSAIIVVGSYSIASGNLGWRIEKRDAITGALIFAFNGTGFVNISDAPGAVSQANSVALDASFMYVIGTGRGVSDRWQIEKRNLSDGALETAFDSDGRVEVDPGASSDRGIAIALDSTSLYITGSDLNGAGQIRLEKRDIGSGALDTAFDGDGVFSVNPGPALDLSLAVAVDQASVYLGGLDQVPGDGQVRLSRHALASGTPEAAFDGDGVLQLNPTAGEDQINDLCVDSAFVYAVGNVGNGVAQDWYILKRNKTTGL